MVLKNAPNLKYIDVLYIDDYWLGVTRFNAVYTLV